MPTAPRPFRKFATVCYHLGFPVPKGKIPFVGYRGYRQARRRQRTRLALSRGTLHYLAARRFTAVRCRQMGMSRLRPGVWYDDLAEVMYAQCMSTDDWGL